MIKIMEKVLCHIEWNGSCYWISNDTIDGVIGASGKTLDEAKKNFKETLDFDIEASESYHDAPPALKDGNYEIEYVYEPSALLKTCQHYTTLAALSEATGISQRQLSFYMNGKHKPRPVMISRIKEGFRSIVNQCRELAVL